MILPLASATTHRRQIIRKKGTKLRYYVLTTRLWTQPKHLIASNTSIDLIKPLGSTYESFWNEPDVVTAAAAVAPW